ncbi:unnamed protein product [Ceutorhynchus assimilis]|uniref:Tektin n=1 Tax=Ceutorhynchus assimilis TaxID=467358 RepID=A0A9N9MCL2_9CUCU|nr:unnamed protein product [Ceutorhynchus assimilis]
MFSQNEETQQNQINSKQIGTIRPPPQKYTVGEWKLNNRHRQQCCIDQQKFAEIITSEIERVKDDAQEKIDLNKKETDRQIKNRQEDIEFNTAEIKLQRKEICTEIDNLKLYMERIKDCLEALENNARVICQKCIVLRDGRIGIDLVHDQVDQELKNELKIIENTEKTLQKALVDANENVRKLKSAMYFIDRDLEDKFKVARIDYKNSILKETNLDLHKYPTFHLISKGNATPEEWNEYTRNNIENAAKEINSGRQFRSYTDIVIRKAINELWNQYYVVNNAFKLRIQEVRDVKSEIEIQHGQIVRQANELIRTIADLDKTLAEKQSFLTLSHNRLDNRSRRPGMELCKDLVEAVLVHEETDLKRNFATMRAVLAEAHSSLRYLMKIKIQLEQDMNVKTNSLKIDEVDCMAVRQSMDYHAY